MPKRARGTNEERLAAVLITIAAGSGVLKASPLLDWLPVDPLVLSLAGLLVLLVNRTARRAESSPRAIQVTALLVAGFLPGVVLSSWTLYAPQKILLLAGVTLPLVFSSLIFIKTEDARRFWLIAQVGFATFTAVGLVLFRDQEQFLSQGRLSLVGGTTISASRAVASGVVLLFCIAVTRHASVRSRFIVTVVAGLGVLLLTQIGSRGPVVALAATVAILVFTARMFGRRRFSTIMFVGTAALGLWIYLSTSASAGAGRLLALVSDRGSGSVDEARSDLFGIAMDAFLHAPWGIGWGDFALVPEVGRYRGEGGQAYPHNLLLEVLCEGGIVAFLAMAVFIYVGFRNAGSSSINTVGLAVYGIAIFWTLAAQTSSDLNGNRFMWVSLAVAVGIGRARLGPTGRLSVSGIRIDRRASVDRSIEV